MASMDKSEFENRFFPEAVFFSNKTLNERNVLLRTTHRQAFPPWIKPSTTSHMIKNLATEGIYKHLKKINKSSHFPHTMTPDSVAESTSSGKADLFNRLFKPVLSWKETYELEDFLINKHAHLRKNTYRDWEVEKTSRTLTSAGA